MLINLVSLELEANADIVTFYPVNDEMRREAMDDENNKFGQAFPRHLCLTTKEALFARGCLLGEAAFYPFMDDGIHLIKFSPAGMTEVYVSESKSERLYFMFPGKELVPYLDAIVDLAKGVPQANSDKVKLTIPKSEIRKWRDEYAPKVKWEYHNPYGKAPYVNAKLAIDRNDERATGLENCIDGLERIAANYSNGIPSIIHLSYDRTPSKRIPSSYYFRIVAGEEQQTVINGGIIAHKNANAETWEYSTHT